MTNRFLGLLVVACAIIGGIVWAALYFNQPSHLDLTGSIDKVRMQPTGPTSTMLLADFRITNPSDHPFVVNAVTVTFEPGGDYAPVPSKLVPKSGLAEIFQYLPLLKPQYNEVLTMQDRIEPHQTVDRMVAAAFDFPQSMIESRKTVRIRIEEFDGAVAEITEKPKQK
jgi:hypothetical protein